MTRSNADALLAGNRVTLAGYEARHFGWAVAGIPLWASILILLVLYSFLARPLRFARKAIYINTSGNNYLWFVAWYEILSTGVLILVCWLAYTHVPQVHDFFQHFVQNMTMIWNNVVDSFHHGVAPKPAAPGIDARLPAAAAAASTSAFLGLRK